MLTPIQPAALGDTQSVPATNQVDANFPARTGRIPRGNSRIARPSSLLGRPRFPRPPPPPGLEDPMHVEGRQAKKKVLVGRRSARQPPQSNRSPRCTPPAAALGGAVLGGARMLNTLPPPLTQPSMGLWVRPLPPLPSRGGRRRPSRQHPGWGALWARVGRGEGRPASERSLPAQTPSCPRRPSVPGQPPFADVTGARGRVAAVVRTTRRRHVAFICPFVGRSGLRVPSVVVPLHVSPFPRPPFPPCIPPSSLCALIDRLAVS